MGHEWPSLLQVRTERQVLAVAVAVMGVDCSPSRPPPSDPHCIPGASFKESRGLRVALTSSATIPGTAPRSGLSTTLQGAPAPPRPAPSLSERRAFPLAGPLTQEEAMPSCASTRGPQPACIRHHRCRCSCPAHYAHESDSSQPSFVCHHPWDTIMSQAETIALACLVKSLHPAACSSLRTASCSRRASLRAVDLSITRFPDTAKDRCCVQHSCQTPSSPMSCLTSAPLALLHAVHSRSQDARTPQICGAAAIGAEAAIRDTEPPEPL
ncbi:hypothetical protein EJ07DRAFT_155769 [Lizonia empirigonia]|nr:hypothetical protein EJ07DRAFT_155769 [Lizonia empirigonia]